MEAREYRQIEASNRFMTAAALQSLRSTDFRRPIGCVVVQDGVIIGKGSNQATIPWKALCRFHVKRCVRKLLGIKKHAFYWLCPGCALFRNHAEARAINDALPKVTTGGIIDMYLFGHSYCCDTCLEKVNGLSINNIYILK